MRAAAWLGAAVLTAVVLSAHPAPAQDSSPGPSAPPAAKASLIDLAHAVVVFAPDASARERKAVQVLVEEIERRTRLRLSQGTAWPDASRPAIAVGRIGSFAPPAGRGKAPALPVPGAEGFQLVTPAAGGPQTVWILGRDERGVLFGVGRFLRELHMRRDAVAAPAGLQISTAPATPLRGHQLGYRPKTNSYDGWTVAMWDQYIRELAIFGANAVELIPPRSDDAPDSPHFPLPQMAMMVEMSRIADEYGLDVWIWYPALDKDYGDPKTVEFALREWAGVFEKLPRIDAVFVPGGDPGHTQPVHMFALLEKQTASLRRFHARAGMWLSPQGFTSEWMEEFYGLLAKEPEWLSGIVFGPQVRDPLPTLRARVPKRYPIRRYPDITHSMRSQYAVRDWDLAHALTSAREPINPRPVEQTIIYRALDEHAIGFLTYSEGCNDDVNKAIWSGLGWDPQTEPIETLRQYSRLFIGPDYADAFAQGLLALERNWQGPLLTNTAVENTLLQFQRMEADAPPPLLLNWRFQQALYRAYYDAYQFRRLAHERAAEGKAMEILARAREIGAMRAVESARAVLGASVRDMPAADLRRRISELAEALYQSIRMQLSVERYGAIAVGRGATLDTVDMPLNDRVWLSARFDEIAALPSEDARLAAIDRIVRWTDPGPGGFYDDLGDPTRQPHLVRGPGLAKDPGSFASASVGFGYRPGWRLSWMTHAESYYDAPVELQYDGLDPSARYRVRVIYAGDVYNTNTRVRLDADGKYPIHPFMGKEGQPAPIEFDIPPDATRDGRLTLTWRQQPGVGGAGRGPQIAEVWLMRAPDRDSND